MIKSKAWQWEVVKDSNKTYWHEPCMESYYLINRWQTNKQKEFLDLGCGLGRHTIIFAKHGFNTHAFDLSENSIESTKEWAIKEKLKIDFKMGDMLNLPYENDSFDCMLCFNVISHTDTEGLKKVISEIYRVLKNNGECYLTLGSKNTWGFKQDWPVVDPNTKIRIEDGPENGIPHFYADEDLINELFNNFKIIILKHVEDDIIPRKGRKSSSWHYHLLIKK